MSNSIQADLQAALRVVTGTSGSFEEDFHAYANLYSIPQYQFGERVLALAVLEDPSIKTSSEALNYFLYNPSAITPNIVPYPVAAPVLTGSPSLLYSWDFGDNSLITSSAGLIDSISGADGTSLALTGTGSSRPLIAPGVGNVQVASFDGLASYLVASGLSITPGMSIVAVGMANAVGRYLVDVCIPTSTNFTDREAITFSSAACVARKADSTVLSDASQGGSNTGMRLIVSRFPVGTVAQLINVDGAGTAATATAVSDGPNYTMINIGSRIGSSVRSLFYSGYVNRILIYTGGLTNTNAEEIAVWAATNYGTPNLA